MSPRQVAKPQCSTITGCVSAVLVSRECQEWLCLRSSLAYNIDVPFKVPSGGMDHWSLCPNVTSRISHIRPVAIIVTKLRVLEVKPVLLKVLDDWKLRSEHKVADFLPQRSMIKSFDVVRSSNFWSLELRAQSSEITISIALGDVVQGESQGKSSSSHTNHDALCQESPHLVAASTCASSS